MNGHTSSNGHHAETSETGSGVNPYVDALAGTKPREIVDFEMNSDPYANMLPGISNIRAARTIGRGVEVGRRGNRVLLAISIILLVSFALPVVLLVLSQLTHH